MWKMGKCRIPLKFQHSKGQYIAKLLLETKRSLVAWKMLSFEVMFISGMGLGFRHILHTSRRYYYYRRSSLAIALCFWVTTWYILPNGIYFSSYWEPLFLVPMSHSYLHQALCLSVENTRFVYLLFSCDTASFIVDFFEIMNVIFMIR